MPQFPAERFRAGAQFFVHTAAAGRFALQRTQSIRGKSRYKRFQRGYISRRLKESTGLRRFLRHEALHGGDQMLKTHLFNGWCRWQLAQSESGNKA